MRPPLPLGLYDAPITELLRERLATTVGVPLEEAIDPEGAPVLLARAVHERLVHALASVKVPDGPQKERRKVEAQVALANRLAGLLAADPDSGALPEDRIDAAARRLLSIAAPPAALGQAQHAIRPEIPLSVSELLVNGRHDVSVGPEIRREIASADRIDLLCSFLKWSGFRLLEEALTEFFQRPRATRPQLRIITTSYMGATERRALDALANLGAEVRVSYDTGHTRLHAKAWLFHRDSGFSTGCIGSSNLSSAAMLDGLEWNVRISQVDNRGILTRFQTVFDQYWADPTFRPYDPAADADTFDEAVRLERSRDHRLLTLFDVSARPHQQEILQSLTAERDRGHTRNLVVAATGTGKTVVAALDYARICERGQARPGLLFVAHRMEILEQSLETFQVVLKDRSFGEILGDGQVPRAGRHVFASVQSLHADRLGALAPDAFPVVIVDEFHHAAAPTYERLLRHLTPRFLLGLTATPERADGKSVLEWFDGRIAAELRLWKALDQGLLAPFQYFGIGDGTHLERVPWSAGAYDAAALTNVYTATDVWIGQVLREARRRVGAPESMRALGFCVSVDHAVFVADRFTRAGLPSAAVSNRTSSADRRAALDDLRDGKLRAVFSVNLFNEGVDVPDVDTVLFLRPTESATVFLQQLGRGLRKAHGKECLTVLDFIGNAHRKFRFDSRFRAILGGTRKSIEREVDRDFPALPSGCSIQLDRFAKEAVLENIRRALEHTKRALTEDLAGIGRDVDLAGFLAETGTDVEDVYSKAGRTWSELRRGAGLPVGAIAEDDEPIATALARLLHVDDPDRLAAYRALVTGTRALTPTDPYARMLFVALGGGKQPIDQLPGLGARFERSPGLRAELVELLDVLEDRLRRPTQALAGRLAETALRLHGSYTRDEVLAAFDCRDSEGKIRQLREGVLFLKVQAVDLLFVTLEKSEEEYSPSTLYNDYVMTQTRVHWESQSTVGPDSPTGQRYLKPGPGARVLLFVRRKRKDERKETSPYLLLGDVKCAAQRGERPIQIEWELTDPMPPEFFLETKAAAG